MRARYRRPEDEDAVIELARLQTAETHPHLTFDEERGRETFRRAILAKDPVIFVAEDDDGQVIGVLMALLCPYSWHSGFFTAQEILSVRPDKRGTRAAALLMSIFLDWSRRMEPEEIFAGVSNGRKVIKFAKWMDRLFGFKPAGVTMRMIRARDGHGKGRD